LKDFRTLRDRALDRDHLYYEEAIGAATLSMVYDLFNCHARERGVLDSSERTSNVVERLVALLETGSAKTHRQVSWYAEKLSVSPKYLSETVKRLTGDSVVYLIGRYSVPILVDYLKDDTYTFTQISDAMGFSSLSYFSRFCRKHLGTSPSAYRLKVSVGGDLEG